MQSGERWEDDEEDEGNEDRERRTIVYRPVRTASIAKRWSRSASDGRRAVAPAPANLPVVRERSASERSTAGSDEDVDCACRDPAHPRCRGVAVRMSTSTVHYEDEKRALYAESRKPTSSLRYSRTDTQAGLSDGGAMRRQEEIQTGMTARLRFPALDSTQPSYSMILTLQIRDRMRAFRALESSRYRSYIAIETRASFRPARAPAYMHALYS
jgi:hypothetical protein